MISRKALYILVLPFFLLAPHICNAQDYVNFSGLIKNARGGGLGGANIILYPSDKAKSPSFGISEDNGKFDLKILPYTEYNVNITFIGFKSIKEVIITENTDIELDFTLVESTQELEEVVINYTPSVEVKKDTTTFRVEAFANGKERKLGAVLKKLPGVSVNRDGEVFFKDKKVENVLVENKTFFTGQPKIATKNIPADVVDEVQIIEDYNETPFLKEFENSDNLVLNIRLKEGKKEFVFGDIESALGSQDRYRVHPSIFKYSPTHIHNFIGDINNTRYRSFTLTDYLNIEGEKSPESILGALSSPIAKFLQNEDFFDNEHFFAGYNFQYNPDTKNELRVFALGMLDNSLRQENFNFTYQPSLAVENRLNDQSDRNALIYGKAKYKYTPDIYTVLKLDFSFNLSRLKNEGNNLSELLGAENEYSSSSKLTNNKITLNTSFNKWFSNRNVSTAKLNFVNSNESLDDFWQSGTNIFSPQIGLRDADIFSVTDIGQRNLTNLDFNLKHHFRPVRTNLVSFGFYGKIYRNVISNVAFQTLGDGAMEGLDDFNNDFSSLLTELNNSITHKWHIGRDIVFDSGLVVQNVSWTDNQLSTENNFTDTKFLPFGRIEWDIDERKSLKLSYNASTSNPDAQSRLAQRDIDDFNRVVSGDPFLEQSTNNRLLLTASFYRAYGFSFSSRLGYRKQESPIVQSISFDGINGIIAPFQTVRDINSFDITFRTRYNRRYWKVSLENSMFKRNGLTVFDGVEGINNSLNFNNTFEFATTYENAPNIELKVENSYLDYSNPGFNNITLSTDIDFSFVYDYRNWKFDFSIYQNFYENRSQQNQTYINLIEARIYYKKEDSPLEIGLGIYNLGNNARQVTNRYNTAFFSESTKRLFPRTIMLSLNYNL